MNNPSASSEVALEHLRVIRTLMERAHHYRAVSAPAALVGGVLALALALYGVAGGSFACGTVFLGAWLALLAVCTVLNLGLLMRESRGQGRALVTDEMRAALRAVLPPLLVGGVLGICLVESGRDLELAALVWILCYGLALLATGSFAPRSIVRLGHAFLWGGVALTLGWFAGLRPGWPQGAEATASLFLGLSFGAFHLIYAAAVFWKKNANHTHG